MIQDLVTSMAGHWLGSLAATFASGSGLLMIGAVLAALYLLRTLSKKLADKIGIGIGPILAIGLLLFAFFSLNGWFGGGGGGSRRLRNVLPPGLDTATAAKTAQARQERRAANDQVQAAVDRAILLMPTGTGPVVPLLPLAATPGFTATPPSFHGAVLPHAAPHASPSTVHVTHALPVATGDGPVAAKAGAGHGGHGIIPPPPAGGNHAPPAPDLRAAQPKSNADPAAPGKVASPPSTGPAVPSAGPAGGGSPAAVSPGRTRRAQPFAGGGRGTTGTPDVGSGSAPAGRSMAEEAAHTLAVRRRRQQQAFGDPGGNGTGGRPAAVTPAFAGAAGHAPPPGGENPFAATARLRRERAAARHDGQSFGMPGGADLAPQMGGMFHPTEGGRLGVPFHPAGNAMNGGQTHAMGGNPAHAGGFGTGMGGFGMGGGFGPMPGMAGGGMGPMGGVHPGIQAGGMGPPGHRR